MKYGKEKIVSVDGDRYSVKSFRLNTYGKRFITDYEVRDPCGKEVKHEIVKHKAISLYFEAIRNESAQPAVLQFAFL